MQKTHKLIKDLQTFKYAYDKFRETFKQKPGDYDGAYGDFGITSVGNNDGNISYTTPSECSRVWRQLGTLGYLGFDVNATSSFLPAEDKDRELTGQQPDLRVYYITTGYEIYLTLNDSSVGEEDMLSLNRWRNSSGSVTKVSIEAQNLLTLDAKIDDSLPWTGKIRGHHGYTPDELGFSICSYDDSGTRRYKLDEEEENCRVIYLIERY